MNIKEYIKQYNKSFVEIKTEYLQYFNSLLEEDKVWLGNIEGKLHLFKNRDIEVNVLNVINKLKSNVNFDEQDTLILSEFISKINIVVNIADRINNFKENTLLENGSRLRVYELFNSIKSVNNFNDLNISLNPNLNNFLPHLFSIIKHCQNPSQYPIYYKYWKNIVREVLCKKDDYDNFCLFYREFPLENRHLTFGSYLGTIGFQIAKNVKKYFPNITKESSEYKFLVDKVINIPRFTDVLDESLLNQYQEETTVKYTKFHHIIQDFETYLKREDSKLQDFSFGSIHRNWVWISDAQKSIGTDKFCHYEIITRKIKPNKLWVEIHFETKYKNHFKALFDNVESLNCFWNEDHKHPELSLAYQEAFDYEDSNLFAKMEKALLHLETNFGDAIRNEFQRMDIKSKIKPVIKMDSPLNQILYGPPGTGKTHNTINRALSILESKSVAEINSETRIDLKNRFDDYIKNGQIVFTTFHQSMSYEDFIEGIKPKTVLSQVQYEIEDGLFKKICQKARIKGGNLESVLEKFKVDVSEEDGKTALTIKATSTSFDVIYRGTNVFYVQPHNTTKENPWYPVNINNIRKAFETDFYGDLYNPTYIREILNYLLKNYGLIKGKNEDDKKYVIIIDEINRGNVSQIFGELITLIEDNKRLGKDEALEVTLPYSKEKFGVPSNLFIIGTMNTADRSVEALDTALRRRFCFEEMPPKTEVVAEKGFSDYSRVAIMEKINNRIEVLLDRNHTLGHAYFIKKNFKSSFENEIIPLLQEYFYNDYGKIGLVLGKGFVREKAITAKNDKSIFADFETKNDVDINKSYELIPFTDVNFDTAIQTLLV